MDMYINTAISLLTNPNILDSINTLSNSCDISLEEAKNLIRIYKDMDYRDANNLKTEYFFNCKVRIINKVANLLKEKDLKNERSI